MFSLVQFSFFWAKFRKWGWGVVPFTDEFRKKVFETFPKGLTKSFISQIKTINPDEKVDTVVKVDLNLWRNVE